MRLAFYTYSYTDKLDMAIEPTLEKIAATGYDASTYRARTAPRPTRIR